MKNNTLNFKPDNKSSLENNEALSQIKVFFDTNFKTFELLEVFNNGDSYNGFRVQYKKQEVIFSLSSSWRGMEHLITIEDHPFSLINFEPKLKDILSCSKNNLAYTLSTLKRFLAQHESKDTIEN